ncbi:MAG: hypothetical protein HBSAPP03_08810 [Phycisphaerae bacterium]|nr:MAG: hypothetical protein HBSAPP03_08810 [Phycisphaerae bacterium]
MVTITRGTCHVMFAYDLGFGIDLDQAQACLAAEGARRGGLRPGPRAPRYVQYEPEPLRVRRPVTVQTIAGVACHGEVEAVLYDFGAVNLTWRFPVVGTLDAQFPLAAALHEHEGLLADSRRVAADLLERIRPAVSRPALVGMVEDYIAWHIESWVGETPAATLTDQYPDAVARLLRAGEPDLSRQEIEETLGVRLSYATHDAAIIDWNASLLLGREQEDALAVLEFSNVELLEMRFLDGQLDRALESAALAVQRPGGVRGLLSHRTAADLRRIATYQADSAMLFESVNNALKLVGDQYLARLYRLVATRLHLPEWDASILRKLHTLDSIYTKVHDRQATRRMEVLEWIIILLIAFEVVMSLVR